MLTRTTAPAKPATVEKKWLLIDAEGLVVGRLASMEAVRTAVDGDGEVLLVMQRDPELREPAPRDLHAVGTLAKIVA